MSTQGILSLNTYSPHRQHAVVHWHRQSHSKIKSAVVQWHMQYHSKIKSAVVHWHRQSHSKNKIPMQAVVHWHVQSHKNPMHIYAAVQWHVQSLQNSPHGYGQTATAKPLRLHIFLGAVTVAWSSLNIKSLVDA